ncbi:hypothetical protein ILUMI_22289 [Ignelater luminosus]|uniref:Golgin-84 n=1 Tax=Ignelater luminosus TaxID=2038154 RepID=A0A8K0G2Z0_IGNLU|nr:hypothetical protein ILUMI_22289 [Ignelater luminosus]
MAWFQNLAGKAEDLLVKFDQNAANVFSDPSQKLLENTEQQDRDSNIIEPSQEFSLAGKLSESDFNIQIEPKISDNIKNWNKSNVYIDNCDIPIFNDNMSIISEKSRLSDNDDNGLVFNSTIPLNKQDISPPPYNGTIESLLKKEPKSEYSGVSSKSGSLQNSFIIMDDPVSNYEEKIVKLEQENEEFNQQLINMRHLYSELQNENSNLHSQLERINETLTMTQNEMEQYRARAERILQEKEKLIKKQDTSGVAIVQDQASLQFYEELKTELKIQEEQYKQLLEKFSRTENELSALQHNFMVAQKDYEIQKHVLQDTLTNERKIRATIEEEYRLKTKKLQSVLDELTQKNQHYCKSNSRNW